MSSQHSNTGLIDHIRSGEERAFYELWERYHERMTRNGKVRLRQWGSPLGASDGEDVAVSAFRTFCRRLVAGEFPFLADEDDLWKLLYTIVVRKANDHAKRETAKRRGGGRVRGDTVFEKVRDAVASSQQDQTETVELMLRDELQALAVVCKDDLLPEVVELKLQAHTNREIADTLGISETSVKRKLSRIREHLEDWQ